MKKKIMGVACAFALALSMSSVAFAANGVVQSNNGSATATITKVYKLTNVDTTNPAETFRFSDPVCTSVANGGVLENGSVIDANYVNSNGLLPTIQGVEFAAGVATVEGAEGTVNITLPAYPAVGVYTYTFNEVSNNVAGVTYDTSVITLVVTVIEQDGKKVVAAVHTEDSPSAASKTDRFENKYSAGELTVSKTVTGNMGDRSKYFDVKVTLSAPTGKTVNSVIGVDLTNASSTENPSTITVGVETTFKLKDGESISLGNIPYEVTYKVEEASYAADGYDAATYSLNGANATTTFVSAEELDAASETVRITNNKGVDVDTAISLESMPFVVMLVAAGAGLAVFAVRRRQED